MLRILSLRRKSRIKNYSFMKRFLIITFLFTIIFAANGQEIVRQGNKYFVGDKNFATSTAFRGYLKNTNHELFAQYNQGYKMAMSGWGLLAFGTAVTPVSTFMLFMNQDATYYNPETGKTTVAQAPPEAWFGGWLSCVILGAGAFCTSIPLLGVGYHKMHTAVDAYSIRQTQNVSAYWTINMKSDGIGLAYHF